MVLLVIVLILLGGVIATIGFKSPIGCCLAFVWVLLFIALLAFLWDSLFK